MENKQPTHGELIDRLQACSLINHPNRPWSDQGKHDISLAWIDKYDELKNKVEELESKSPEATG